MAALILFASDSRFQPFSNPLEKILTLLRLKIGANVDFVTSSQVIRGFSLGDARKPAVANRGLGGARCCPVKNFVTRGGGWHFTPLTLNSGVETSLDAIEGFGHSFGYHTEGRIGLSPERNRACRIETVAVVTHFRRALKI
jgi:hypothetical protein